MAQRKDVVLSLKSLEKEEKCLAGQNGDGFNVQYEVKECDYGLGLFAKQFIPRGSLIWKWRPGVNVNAYSNIQEIQERLSAMNKEEQDFFMGHVYLFDSYMNEILDDGCYWNHSETPNTGVAPFSELQSAENCTDQIDWCSTYAIRDIQPGEQLLEDYGMWEYPQYFLDLAKEYSVPQDFIIKKDFMKPGFHIDYEVKQSKNGVGIFSNQFIPKHTLIWKYVEGFNTRLFKTEQECLDHLLSLGSSEKEYEWMSHLYCCDGYVYEILDDGKILNNSGTPNMCSGYNGDNESLYAKQDIEVGEELLNNHELRQKPDFFIRLSQRHNFLQ